MSWTAGPVVQSEQSWVEYTQNCGDDSGLQEEFLSTVPHNLSQEHCLLIHADICTVSFHGHLEHSYTNSGFAS